MKLVKNTSINLLLRIIHNVTKFWIKLTLNFNKGMMYDTDIFRYVKSSY